MEAHVTVLAPFRHASTLDEEATATLASMFAMLPPFRFELVTVQRFEDGTVYLAPVPAELFVSLTETVTTRFPEHQPYGGAFETLVPHLTIGRDVDGSVTAAAGRLPLPIRSAARIVTLVERGDDRGWHRRCAFRLGGR